MRRRWSWLLSVALPRPVHSRRTKLRRMRGKSAAAGSTRLNIIDKSLADTLERLREMPPGPRVRELRAKAKAFQRVVHAWAATPPSEGHRTELLRLVLELNVEVMALGRDRGGETSNG
jgi:hypothetical protein